MLFEAIFAPFFMFGRFLISLIPNIDTFTSGAVYSFYDFVGIGLYFFGAAPFVTSIMCVIFWIGADLGWSCCEWLYKKIPGVD